MNTPASILSCWSSTNNDKCLLLICNALLSSVGSIQGHELLSRHWQAVADNGISPTRAETIWPTLQSLRPPRTQPIQHTDHDCTIYIIPEAPETSTIYFDTNQSLDTTSPLHTTLERNAPPTSNCHPGMRCSYWPGQGKIWRIYCCVHRSLSEKRQCARTARAAGSRDWSRYLAMARGWQRRVPKFGRGWCDCYDWVE